MNSYIFYFCSYFNMLCQQTKAANQQQLHSRSHCLHCLMRSDCVVRKCNQIIPYSRRVMGDHKNHLQSYVAVETFREYVASDHALQRQSVGTRRKTACFVAQYVALPYSVARDGCHYWNQPDDTPMSRSAKLCNQSIPFSAIVLGISPGSCHRNFSARQKHPFATQRVFP